jgi:hypothetical protein
MIDAITKNLGDKADYYLGFNGPKIAKERIHVPGADWVDRIFAPSDRSNKVLGNLQRLYGTGRLANTGYLSILPVDQGIEHSAGASFAPNPSYFDPENIVRLAIDGGCERIPSLPPGRGIPRKARVPTYRAEEKYALVWVCLDEPHAPIPNIPEISAGITVHYRTHGDTPPPGQHHPARILIRKLAFVGQLSTGAGRMGSGSRHRDQLIA